MILFFSDVCCRVTLSRGVLTFLFPSRQQPQEQRGFQDKCIGLPLHRQRQVSLEQRTTSGFLRLTDSHLHILLRSFSLSSYVFGFSSCETSLPRFAHAHDGSICLDVKSTPPYSFFRPYQRSWLLYKSHHAPPPPTSAKPPKQIKPALEGANLPSLSALSLSSASLCPASTVDASSEHHGSSMSILTVA